MLVSYTVSLRGDEGGVHTALGKLVADSCDVLCAFLFGRISSGQLICFGFDCISRSRDGRLRLLEVHPERALISEVGFSLSKTGLVTGRQALTTPSDDSRQVNSAISAY